MVIIYYRKVSLSLFSTSRRIYQKLCLPFLYMNIIAFGRISMFTSHAIFSRGWVWAWVWVCAFSPTSTPTPPSGNIYLLELFLPILVFSRDCGHVNTIPNHWHVYRTGIRRNHGPTENLSTTFSLNCQISKCLCQLDEEIRERDIETERSSLTWACSSIREHSLILEYGQRYCLLMEILQLRREKRPVKAASITFLTRGNPFGNERKKETRPSIKQCLDNDVKYDHQRMLSLSSADHIMGLSLGLSLG